MAANDGGFMSKIATQPSASGLGSMGKAGSVTSIGTTIAPPMRKTAIAAPVKAAPVKAAPVAAAPAKVAAPVKKAAPKKFTPSALQKRVGGGREQTPGSPDTSSIFTKMKGKPRGR